MWSCEFKRELDQSPELKAVYDRVTKNVRNPLHLPDAFFGGRTEVFTPFLKLTPELLSQGWRIKYYDITSLYSFVLKVICFKILY